MLLSNLKKSTVGKKVLIDDDVVVLYVPSIDRKVWTGIYKTPFLLSNCKGIIIPNKIQKINKKPFNGRVHYLEAKKHLVELKNVTKKISVFGTTDSLETKDTQAKKVKQFFFYDMTYLMEGIKQFLTKLPEKTIYKLLVFELGEVYNKIKKAYPSKKIITLLDIYSKNDLFYLFLINIKQIKSQLKDTFINNRFFDSFLFASVNERLLPMAEYGDDGEIKPLMPMIVKLDAFLENVELADEMDGTPAISNKVFDDNSKQVPNESLATQIVNTLASSLNPNTPKSLVTPDKVVQPKEKQLKVKAKATEDDNIEIELDGKTLSKVMQYYKVKNPDIIANVKAAIDEYIKETGTVPTKANAELLVLKAVHKSIHGTDEINEKYLANPNLLFEKLQNIDVFSVPLNFPKSDETFPFDITDVVTLKNTTGLHRQKYEFYESLDENIKQVFKVLENQKHPIKVLGITKDYFDNNVDRCVEYTIKLQNMDGNKQKYDLKLNIPTILSDRYLKIGGNRYIFSNQQHFKTLTKTKKNKVRVLTNYATLEFSVENLKFNISDINELLHYIQQRYPTLLTEVTEDFATFNNGDKIYFTGNNVLESVDTNIKINPETNKLFDPNDQNRTFKSTRFEFLFDFIAAKVKETNPDDSLGKTKKSIPYLSIYMSGIKIPYILYMWSQLGLLTTLNRSSINYEITTDRGEVGEVILELTDNRFLVLRPETIRERLIVNGLLVNKIKYPLNNLDSREEINKHISETYGARTIFLIDNLTTNMLDPISKQLLEFENHPTNLPGLLGGPAMDMLLNQKPDTLTDLKIYRTRMSEIMVRILYKQLTRAANSYAHRVEKFYPYLFLIIFIAI